MISFLLFSVRFLFPDGHSCEVSAEDLSADGFTFRLTQADAAAFTADPPTHVRCVFRGLGHPLEAEPTFFSLLREEDEGDAACWRVCTDDSRFLTFMRAVMQDILTYQTLKNTCTDAEVTAHYTRLSSPAEERYPADLSVFRASLFASLVPDAAWADTAAQLSLFWSLSFPETADAFLSLPFDRFSARFFAKAGLAAHPVSRLKPTGLCFGNAFCPSLFPDRTELLSLLRRASKLSLKALVAFPPVPEDRFDQFTDILSALAALPEDERPELLINDWGLAVDLLRRFPDHFRLTAGPLLARRVKDPHSHARLPEETPPAFSPADGPEFSHLLTSLGFRGILLEADGRLPSPGPGDSVVFPFFQLSTATRCALHAVCAHGARGIQPENDPCTRECIHTCFVYPQSEKIIGRGNSLFGADTRLLTDVPALTALHGSRLILDLL